MTFSTPSIHLTTAHLLRQGNSGLSLLGNRCQQCHELYFPAAAHCTACHSDALAACEIGSHGQLWSWTVQAFEPKSPYDSGGARFEPYGVGYIQMPGGVKVESRLTCADPDQLRIGMPMHLCLVDYGQRADGTRLQTFAFGPATVAGDR